MVNRYHTMSVNVTQVAVKVPALMIVVRKMDDGNPESAPGNQVM